VSPYFEPNMDEDKNPDRLLSEPPEAPSQPQERTSTLSAEAPPPSDDVPPLNGDPDASAAAPPPEKPDPNARIVHEVVNSEVSAQLLYTWSMELSALFQIGVSTLLNRLKQSIASAKVCVSIRSSACNGRSLIRP
jgi:hypothetical protein